MDAGYKFLQVTHKTFQLGANKEFLLKGYRSNSRSHQIALHMNNPAMVISIVNPATLSYRCTHSKVRTTQAVPIDLRVITVWKLSTRF